MVRGWLKIDELRWKNRGMANWKQGSTAFISLAQKCPEIAVEADGWDPNLVPYGSDKKLSWKCKEGHTWQATVSNRSGRKSGCPYCTRRLPIVGKTDLRSLFPVIASEANGWNPEEYGAWSSRKMSWKCELGHVWESTITSRCSQSTKCPICSNRTLLQGFNDIQTRYPRIAVEADGWDPRLVCSENFRANWKCSKGHKWNALISDRRRGDNCPYCSGRRVLPGFNDLATTHPDVANEASGWNPQEVTFGSRTKLEWKCKQGHKWLAQTNDRVGRSSGCPYCANKKLLVGFNDLATTHPKLASEASGWNPTEIMAAHSKKLEWVCSYGHKWLSQPLSRSHQDTGCLVCAGKQVLVGFNDLATTHPEIAKEAEGWDPTLITAGSNKRFLWKCEEGHTWKAQPNSRTGSVKSGCPTCANSGFDPNKPGYFYFLEHPNWELFQIGITNYPDKRLATHRKLGWNILELRGPMDGHLTREWETSVLKVLRNKKVGLGPTNVAGKFTGFSESWPKVKLSFESISEIFNMVRDLN